MKKYIPFVAFLSTLYHDQAHAAQRIFHQSFAQETMFQQLAEELSSQEDFIYFPEHVEVHPFAEIIKSSNLFHYFIKGSYLEDDQSKNVINAISYSCYLPFLNRNRGWIKPLMSVLTSMDKHRERFDIIVSTVQIFLRQPKPKEIVILSKILSKMKQNSRDLNIVASGAEFYEFIWEEKLLRLFKKNM